MDTDLTSEAVRRAIAIVMRENACGQAQATEILRVSADSQRIPVQAVAEAILALRGHAALAS